MKTVNILFSILIAASLPRTTQSFSQGQPKASQGSIKCTNDSNCMLNAYCYLNVCNCNDGYSPYRDKTGPRKKDYQTICLKEASFIGDHCTQDIQCKATFGNHAICQQEHPSNQVGRCECLEYAHFKDGLCYKTAVIDGACDVNDNCLIKSKDLQAFCYLGKCICPRDHHPTDDRTDCQASSGLGGSCKDNVGCKVFKSECKHGFCRCGPRFIASEDKNYCLSLADKLEDPCEEHSQCITYLQNTRCDENRGVCICESGTHILKGSCWSSANILESCNENAECYLNETLQQSVECNAGICQCKTGYALDQQKYCIRDNTTIPSSGMKLSLNVFVHSGIFILLSKTIISVMKDLNFIRY